MIVEKSVHTRLIILLSMLLISSVFLSLLAYLCFFNAGIELFLLILYEASKIRRLFFLIYNNNNDNHKSV